MHFRAGIAQYVRLYRSKGALQSGVQIPVVRFIDDAGLVDRQSVEAMRTCLEEYRGVFERVETPRKCPISQSDDDPGPAESILSL